MSDDKASKEALLNVGRAGETLVWNAGYIALPWLKLKAKAKADANVKTYSISADGEYRINPKWYASQRPDERVFELATSMMTFLLRHHDRGVALGVVDPQTGGPMPGQEHNHGVWNRARAMVVNKPCHEDSIGRAPADAVMPPSDYKGHLDAESLYYWLLKNEPPPPPGSPPPGGGGGGGGGQDQQQAPPHAGGNVQPPPAGQPGEGGEGEGEGEGGDPGQQKAPGGGGQLTADDIDQMRRDVETMARQAGRGTHLAEALRPKKVRTNYRSVIGAGMDVANTESSERTKKTFSRASRRESLDPSIVLAGYEGSDPTLAVVIDFSGSTGMFAQKFVDHAQAVATSYPNTRILLVAHTDRVTYQAWLKPGGEPAKLSDASKFSGGTDFAPAYDAAREEAKKLPGAKFDALVHFTDGYNFSAWPRPPSRRLVVGLCGDGHGITPLPMVAKVVPVTMGQ